MKLANHSGRAVIVIDDRVADVHATSHGRFGPDVMDCYEHWSEFVEFAASVTEGTEPLDESALSNPVPLPRQIFAIGLNYADHAAESAMALPEKPVLFDQR